jgi:hypothetical protein
MRARHAYFPPAHPCDFFLRVSAKKDDGRFPILAHTPPSDTPLLLTSLSLLLLDAFWGALDQTEPCVPRPRAVPREPNCRVHHPLTPVQTWRRMGVSCFLSCFFNPCNLVDRGVLIVFVFVRYILRG